MIKSLIIIVIFIFLSACSSKHLQPQGQAGFYFHKIHAKNSVVKTTSTYGLGQYKYKINYLSVISTANIDGLKVVVYTDDSSEGCLLEDEIDLYTSLSAAFPQIESFFSGHKVKLIFTRKDNFTFESISRSGEPIYFAVKIDNCDGLIANTQSIFRGIEIIYHELYHLESYLQKMDFSFEEEEKKATIFGICALLSSGIAQRVVIPEVYVPHTNTADPYILHNLSIKKDAYNYIVSNFNSHIVDLSSEKERDKAAAFCKVNRND